MNKILKIIITIIIPYLIIIYIFPLVGYKIDNLIGFNLNSNINKSIENIFKKISDAKVSTDTLIDSVGENTKNKTIKERSNINEIINQ